MTTPILVVGDSMLDRYWEGRVDRISPEAPVPVLQVTREFSRAGGAANVALNLAALGARVSLLTLVGDDDAGQALARHLEQGGVELHAVGGSRHRTTQKIRCVAQHHQLLRTDFEDQASEECVASLQAAFGHVLPRQAVVVMSDYAKGALRDCPELIAQARSRACRVLVDPKGTDFERYAGADLLKPNANELRAVAGAWTGDADMRARCLALRRRLRLGALLVTRGEQGMTLFDEQGERHHAAEVREVYDVSGAGDTVLASLAHFIAEGHAIDEAVRWANRAAGIAVSKFGTAVVTREEIERAHGPIPQAVSTTPPRPGEPRPSPEVGPRGPARRRVRSTEETLR